MVYQAPSSSPVPEANREVAQSITTILPGSCAGELYMTKGHQHPDAQGEIYLGLSGTGGLLMHDGTRTSWVDMAEGVMGYIPPGWASNSKDAHPAREPLHESSEARLLPAHLEMSQSSRRSPRG